MSNETVVLIHGNVAAHERVEMPEALAGQLRALLPERWEDLP